MQSGGWPLTYTFSTSKPSYGKRFISIPRIMSHKRVISTAPMSVSTCFIPSLLTFSVFPPGDNQLVIFGGMSNQPDSINPEELCVLNDVSIFNISTGHWLPSSPSPTSDPLLPRARYAHLSSVTSNRLFVIGGQDFNNTWLDDICIYDLVRRAWIHRREYPRHCGTYRSVAVSSTTTVRLPQEERRNFPTSPSIGPPGQRFGRSDRSSALEPSPAESLIHLPYTAPPTDDFPSDIYLYSNYNVGSLSSGSFCSLIDH